MRNWVIAWKLRYDQIFISHFIQGLFQNFQSIVEDAAFMLKEVNLSQVVEYPYYRKATDTDLIKQYFTGLTKQDRIHKLRWKSYIEFLSNYLNKQIS